MSSTSTQKKNPKKTGLGRGLGSLLGGLDDDLTSERISTSKDPVISGEIKESFVERDSTPRVPETARIWHVDISKLKRNENQPRKSFEAQALQDLSNSIKEKGVLQPIVARKKLNGDFEIIAGERRWRAAQKAGLSEVPVILRNTDDQDALELALIENIQREDLNPIEEAEAYSYLAQEYDLTQQQLADKVGKERATVANVMRLLNLVPEVRKLVFNNEITLGQAKVLLSISDPLLQKKVGRKVAKDKLTVKATEKLIQRLKNPNKQASSEIGVDVSHQLMKGLSEELQKIIGTKVTIDYTSGKGKVSVHFYSDDELNSFVDKVRSRWQK